MSERMTGNQLRVVLDREERLALLRECSVSEALRKQLDYPSSRPVEVWMSLDEADDLREEVAGVLQVRGFDASYKTTQLGELLERLVDKLFTG